MAPTAYMALDGAIVLSDPSRMILWDPDSIHTLPVWKTCVPYFVAAASLGSDSVLPLPDRISIV
jgi:hypothetical protein